MLIEDREGEHDPRTLELANGITLGTQYGMIPLGAGALGLLFWLADMIGVAGHWVYVLVFWLDALTYIVSYFAIRSIPDLGPRRHDEGVEPVKPAEPAHGEPGHVHHFREHAPHRQAPSEGFLAALRLPVVRGILPGIAVVALGLGALFSVGVLFVRNVLRAGPFGFGVLVTLFGVGAVLGLLVLRRDWTSALPTQIRVAIATQGLVIAAMGAVASELLAYGGAVLFGAAATSALVGALTYIQEGLSGFVRNLALTAFHATLRAGLAVAALLAGAAADLLRRLDAGLLGFDPIQVVLMGSGVVVFSGVFFIRTPGPEGGDEDGLADTPETTGVDESKDDERGPDTDKRSLLEEDRARRNGNPARWTPWLPGVQAA
jgi:hypothetical protein